MDGTVIKTFSLTSEAIETYLKAKGREGVTSASILKYRDTFKNLYQWLAGNLSIDHMRLQEWRNYLEQVGYSKATVQKYVTRVNNFLRYYERNDLCIRKPIRNDLTGKVFGYLTVLEATEKRQRRNVVWKCSCKCGKEVEVPTTILLSGNTTSCGCLNREILQHVNRYVEGTSLRQCLDDRVVNENSISGYVGVQQKRDKWTAYINYKGVRYHLGTYENIEDAVQARARAKEKVMEVAMNLYEEYADCYEKVPHRSKIAKQEGINYG